MGTSERARRKGFFVMSEMSRKAKEKARKVLSERYGWNCFYCGKKLVPDGKWKEFCYSTDGHSFTPIPGYGMPQLDHILPSSRGGGNALDNLVLCCGQCNSRKNDRTPDEWIVI